MFGGESQKVTFKIDRSRFDDVVDWFGTDFKIRESAEDYYIISVDVNVNAMYYWALQYGVYVEVLSPEDLRNNIRKTVGSIYRKYLHKLDNTNKLDDDDDE
jgi:predicted DNA-binding transcriptional regulator YafY